MQLEKGVKKQTHFSGLLMPCREPISGMMYKAKLRTEHSDYYLKLGRLEELSIENFLWEMIDLRGELDLFSAVISVKSISLAEDTEFMSLEEESDIVNRYQSHLKKHGKIEVDFDSVAS